MSRNLWTSTIFKKIWVKWQEKSMRWVIMLVPDKDNLLVMRNDYWKFTLGNVEVAARPLLKSVSFWHSGEGFFHMTFSWGIVENENRLLNLGKCFDKIYFWKLSQNVGIWRFSFKFRLNIQRLKQRFSYFCIKHLSVHVWIILNRENGCQSWLC